MEQTLHFEDKTGHKTAGILAKPDGPTDRIAVLCHGFLSQKNSSTNKALTAALVPQGIATFRFDFLGHGESREPFPRITVTMSVAQTLAALETVAQRGYRRIGLVGSSFGGLIAILAAAKWMEEGRTGLTCLALKCPVADFSEMLREEFGEAGMAEWSATGTIPNVVGGVGRIRLPYSFYDDCLQHIGFDHAKAVTIPTLIVHGDADEVVPVEQSRRLAAGLGGPHSLVVIPGADHHFSNPLHFREMSTRIAEWLTDHLGAHPAI